MRPERRRQLEEEIANSSPMALEVLTSCLSQPGEQNLSQPQQNCCWTDFAAYGWTVKVSLGNMDSSLLLLRETTSLPLMSSFPRAKLAPPANVCSIRWPSISVNYVLAIPLPAAAVKEHQQIYSYHSLLFILFILIKFTIFLYIK